MKELNKWDWRCALFGHAWIHKDGKIVCKRCGKVQ